MKTKTILISLAAIPLLSAAGWALNPHGGDPVDQPAPAAPAPSWASTAAVRAQCLRSVEAQLTRPESLKVDWFTAGLPDAAGRWSFAFDAGNAFGATGHYAAACDDGVATISVNP